MRRQRGFTLTELVSASTIIFMVIAGTVALMLSASQGLGNTVAADKTVIQTSQGMRYMSEALRSAMSVTINETGSRIDYVLPKLSTAVDAATGEKELLDPLVSDGVARSFITQWTAFNLYDGVTNKMLCRNLYRTDPEPTSSQYNKAYPVFQMTTIGSSRAVTITLISREQVGTQWKTTRLKTTTLLRNYKG
ncbi:MAG: PilW family protein [Fimbriimonas sp.]